MRLWIAAVALGLVLALPSPASAQRACPLSGNATTAKLKALDTLKNRETAPTQMDTRVALEAMLAKGDDQGRWDEQKGAQVEGFVVGVKPGGIESVNCGAKSIDERDTHIELALTKTAKKNQFVIVEVTPRWRKAMAAKGEDWRTPTLEGKLKGHKVRITGWLFFDEEHTNASENTHPGGKNNWRGTAWEIHPITAIEIID